MRNNVIRKNIFWALILSVMCCALWAAYKAYTDMSILHDMTYQAQNLRGSAVHGHMHDIGTKTRSTLSSLYMFGFLNVALLILLYVHYVAWQRADKKHKRMQGLLEPRIAAMQSVKDGIYICNVSGQIKFANPSLMEMYGYSELTDIIDQHWSILYSGSDLQLLDNSILNTLSQTKQWHGHLQGIRKDGAFFGQDITISILADNGWICVVRDHTEITQYMELANNRLAAIEAVRDGIGITDSYGKLVYINTAMMDLYGLDRKDKQKFIGQNWHKLYNEQGQKQIEEYVLPQVKEKGYWAGESLVVLPEGKKIIAELSMTALPDGGIIGTIRDITQRKRDEQEKEELQQQFFQAQKMEAIGRLAGGMAHDFNNILASISGYTDFLLEDLNDDSKERQFAEKIMQGTAEARQLIDQILTFSRRSEIGQDVMDMVDVVNEMATILKGMMPRSVSVKVDIQNDAAYVSANQSHITQLLMNLCINAKDSMNESGELGIGLSVVQEEELPAELKSLQGNEAVKREKNKLGRAQSMQVYKIEEGKSVLCLGDLMPAPHFVKLSVTDQGSGISYEVMEHMFEPFFTTKSAQNGTGLGLSSVLGIITGHRGALMVHSELGKGSEFHLYLSLCEEVRAGETYKGDEFQDIDDKSYDVLLVEDQESVIVMMEQMLERLGHKGSFARSAEEAIDLLRERNGKFDVVVTDYTMPGMTGVDLARTVLEDFEDLPVIILSGYSKQKLNNIDLDIPNIRSVLKKPVDKELLALHIHKAVQGYRISQDLKKETSAA